MMPEWRLSSPHEAKNYHSVSEEILKTSVKWASVMLPGFSQLSSSFENGLLGAEKPHSVTHNA